MEQTPPRHTVVLGIDPGRSTGLYSVSIPRLERALTLVEFQKHGRWLGNACVNLSTRESAQLPFRWAEMHERISNAIGGAAPALIVLEHPADGMPKWSSQGRGSARGTDFNMGMFFGFAALAAATFAELRPGLAKTKIALVPVTSSKAAGRVGWMPKVTTQKGQRRVTHTQDRETTLRQCREIARQLDANAWAVQMHNSAKAADALSDHELMALGVLTYYITHKAPAEWDE